MITKAHTLPALRRTLPKYNVFGEGWPEGRVGLERRLDATEAIDAEN